MNVKGMNDYPNKYEICYAFVEHFNLKLVSEVGKGSTGLVFKVEEKAAEKIYPQNICLKIMPVNIFKETEYDIARKITMDNTTNNIVKHYNKLCFYEFVGLIQEFVDGGNLADYVGIAGKPDEKMRILNEMEIRLFFMDILHGIREVHRRNLIHRDLKPENILVHKQDDGTLCLKIADFGYIREMDNRGMAQTLCGTPHHMCPEQLNQQSNYTIAADVWSLGVLFFRLIFHNYPFPARNFLELLQKVNTFQIQDLQRTVPHPPNVIVPSWAWNIIARCLERTPEKRPTSAQLYDEICRIQLQSAPLIPLQNAPQISLQSDPLMQLQSAPLMSLRSAPLIQLRNTHVLSLSPYYSSPSSSYSSSPSSPACSKCLRGIPPILSLVHPKSITCSACGHMVCFACIRDLFTTQIEQQRHGVSLCCVKCGRAHYRPEEMKDMLSVNQYEIYIKTK